MPRGPQGRKRPAGVVGCAVHVARIATGEVEDTRENQGASNPQGNRTWKFCGNLVTSRSKQSTNIKDEDAKASLVLPDLAGNRLAKGASGFQVRLPCRETTRH